MSKNAGGRHISSSHSIAMISSPSFARRIKLIDFQETMSKTWQSSISVSQTCLSIIPLSATRSICVIITWQSWDFIPLNHCFFVSRYLRMLPQYQELTLIPSRQLKVWSSSFLDRVKQDGLQ
jgi:hypothetical protein